MGVKWFKLVANPGEVSVNRTWFDMMAHVDGKETEGIRDGVNGEIMGPAESYI